jgi:hypothetical protein
MELRSVPQLLQVRKNIFRSKGVNLMEKRLEEILQHVNGWLKFAEAKNAAIVAFDGTALFGMFTLIKDFPWVLSNGYMAAYVLSFCVFSSLSLLIALASFLPQIKLPKPKVAVPNPVSYNLLFYGHLSQQGEKEYLDALASGSSETAKADHSALEISYANQIIVNSKITVRKYSYFSAALWLSICAIATPIFGIIFMVLVRRYQR